MTQVTLAYDSAWVTNLQKFIDNNEEKILQGDMRAFMISLFERCMAIYYDRPNEYHSLFNSAYLLFYFYRYHQSKNQIEFDLRTKKIIYYFINIGMQDLANELNYIYKDSLDQVKLAKAKIENKLYI